MYVVTGIWLHMRKCMVECRWETILEVILKLMDGTMKCIEVPENARLKSHQRDATWHEAVILVSLHHPTRSYHHQGIEICRIWFDNSPTLAGNDYSKGSGKGTKDAKAWEKIRKRISSCFWRSCDCFDDASILNGHDIVGEKGRQRAKKSRHINVYMYIYILSNYCPLLTFLPLQ